MKNAANVVCAKWITYNAVDTIAWSLASVAEFVDCLVVVDGNFRTGRRSNDGTWELTERVLKRIGKPFIHAHGAGTLYHEQHNISLDFVPQNVDWILQLDSDEVYLPNELPRLRTIFESPHDAVGPRWPTVTMRQGDRWLVPKELADRPEAVMRIYRKSPGLRFVCTNGISEAPVDDRGTIQSPTRLVAYPWDVSLFHYHCFETPGQWLDKHLFYRSKEQAQRSVFIDETRNMLKHFDVERHDVFEAHHPLVDLSLWSRVEHYSENTAPRPSWKLRSV